MDIANIRRVRLHDGIQAELKRHQQRIYRDHPAPLKMFWEELDYNNNPLLTDMDYKELRVKGKGGQGASVRWRRSRFYRRAGSRSSWEHTGDAKGASD